MSGTYLDWCLQANNLRPKDRCQVEIPTSDMGKRSDKKKPHIVFMGESSINGRSDTLIPPTHRTRTPTRNPSPSLTLRISKYASSTNANEYLNPSHAQRNALPMYQPLRFRRRACSVLQCPSFLYADGTPPVFKMCRQDAQAIVLQLGHCSANLNSGRVQCAQM